MKSKVFLLASALFCFFTMNAQNDELAPNYLNVTFEKSRTASFMLPKSQKTVYRTKDLCILIYEANIDTAGLSLVKIDDRVSYTHPHIRYEYYQQYHRGIRVVNGGALVAINKSDQTINKVIPHIYTIQDDPASNILDLSIESSQKKELIYLPSEHHIDKMWEVITTTGARKKELFNASNGRLMKTIRMDAGITLQGQTIDYGNVTLQNYTNNGLTYLQNTNKTITVYIPSGFTASGQPIYNEQGIPKTTSTTAWGQDALKRSQQAFFVTEKVKEAFINKLSVAFNQIDVISTGAFGAFAWYTDDPNDAIIQIGALNAQNIDGPNFALYDVIAHELCHSFLYRSLDYDYYADNDFGVNTILQEGLADIFGTYLEYHIRTPNTTDYIQGGDNAAIAQVINRDHTMMTCMTDNDTPHKKSKAISHWFYTVATQIPTIGFEGAQTIVMEAISRNVNRKAGPATFRKLTLDIVQEVYNNAAITNAVKNIWDQVCVFEAACSQQNDIIVAGVETLVGGTYRNITVLNTSVLTLHGQFDMQSDGSIQVYGTLNVGTKSPLTPATLDVCNGLGQWRGIKVYNQGKLFLNLARIFNATIGVEAFNGATIQLQELKIEGNPSFAIGMMLHENIRFGSKIQYTGDVKFSNLFIGIVLQKTGLMPLPDSQPNLFRLTFQDCNTGIEYNNCSSQALFCYFDDCRTGIFIKDALSSPKIETCYFYGAIDIGIRLSKSRAEITDCIIGTAEQPARIGISGTFTRQRVRINSAVTNTQIYAYSRGISLVVSPLSEIYDCEIHTIDGPVNNKYGIFAAKTNGAAIFGNNIQTLSGSCALLSSNNTDYDIINNNISMTNATPGLSSAVIKVQSAHGGRLDENLIEGSTGIDGLAIYSSAGNDVECNNFIDNHNDINIFFTSDNTTLATNYFDATDQDLTIRSQIGPQLHHGNRFWGGKAKALGLTLDQLVNSRFIVNTAYNVNVPYLPPTREPMDDWFENTPGQGVPIECDSIAIGNGVNDLCDYWSSLLAIKDTLPQRFFINTFHLLLMAELDTNLVLPPCITADSTLLSLCGLQSLLAVQQNLDSLDSPQDRTTAIRNLQQQLASTTDPTAQAQLATQITTAYEVATLAVEADQRSDSLQWSKLYTKLDSLDCDSLIVDIWRDILQSYIKFRLHDSVALADRALVLSQASLCADLYGDMVYLARVLAATFTDTSFEDHDGCIDLPTPRSREEEKMDNSFDIYPNPTVDQALIQFKRPFRGNIKITDLEGKIVFEIELKDPVSSYDFMSSLWTSGLYVITCQTVDGLVLVKKVLKL